MGLAPLKDRSRTDPDPRGFDGERVESLARSESSQSVQVMPTAFARFDVAGVQYVDAVLRYQIE